MTTVLNTRFFVRCLFALLFVLTGCGGCDGGGDPQATVVIDAVEPVGGYPGVEVDVSFTITPGENANEGGMAWAVDFGDGISVTGDGVQGTASHAFQSPGTYEITVFAKFEGETAGTETIDYVVYSPVDLSVERISGAPVNITVGDDVTLDFLVKNNVAADVFTPYSVDVYLSSSPAINADDVADLQLLGSTEVSSQGDEGVVIASGGERNSGFTTTMPAVESGDYYVVALLDPEEQVADTDRENNLAVSSGILRVENPEDLLPDVSVDQLTYAPDRAFPALNSVTRGFAFRNNSSVDAFGLRHRTYLSIGDGELDDSDILIAESEEFDLIRDTTLDVGPEEIVLDNPIVPPTGMEMEVWLIIEAVVPAELEESDTGNNILVTPEPILVTDQPVEGPDIVVRSFSATPNSTFLDGPLKITTEIANEGTADVGSFFCGIYLGAGPRVNTQNDPRLSNLNIPALPSGEVINIETDIIIPGLYDPGVYYLYIVCDPLNALQEPFRSNNQLIQLDPITVTDDADVDLFIEELRVPMNANEGDTVDVVARICVQGTNPSGDTQGKLYLTIGDTVDFAADAIETFDIPNIVPGSCEEVTLPVTVDCADFEDTYAFGVSVDTLFTLPETNEENNRKAGNNRLMIAGEFCTCAEDLFEPNDRPLDAVPVTPGSFDAALCTPGNCDYYGVDAAANDTIIVETTYQTDKGRLVTTMFDTTGVQVLDSSSEADAQQVGAFVVPQAGRYLFNVCGAGADRNFYDVDVTVTPQPAGVDLIAQNVGIPASNSYSIGAKLRVDYRVYNVGASASGDYDVRFWISPDRTIGDGNDTQVTQIGNTTIPGGAFRDLSTTITIPTTLMDGDYYVGVEIDPAPRQLTETDTTNNISVSRQFEIKTLCFDPLEPNDDFGTAPVTAAGSYANLVVCSDADDFYRICPGNAKEFDVTVNFDDDAGDIDLELFDSQFNRIDSSANTGVDVEQVSVPYVNGDQCFYAVVRLITLMPDVETNYSLDIQVRDVDPTLVCSSTFEPNDSFQTASSLLPALGLTSNLDRCPVTDTDFYYVDLTAGQNVNFRATKTPNMQGGTLRIQLYKPGQIPGPNSESAPAVPTAEIANFIAATTGRHYLQVTFSGTTRNATYTLGADGLGGVDLSPSNLSIGFGSYRIADEVRFSATVANLRSDTATGGTYTVWFSDSATHDPMNDINLGTFNLPDIVGNSSQVVGDRVAVPGSATNGTRYLHFVTGVMNDADTTNDIATTTIEIVP